MVGLGESQKRYTFTSYQKTGEMTKTNLDIIVECHVEAILEQYGSIDNYLKEMSRK